MLPPSATPSSDSTTFQLRKIRTFNSWAAESRFLAGCRLTKRTIPRQAQIPRPYYSSPVEVLWRYGKIDIIVCETRHKHLEVYAVEYAS